MQGPFFMASAGANFLLRNMTTRFRTLPQMYVLGAPKCGTTSLYEVLLQHPNFIPPAYNLKELEYLQEIPHFADYEFSGIRKFLVNSLIGKYKGPDSYKKFFPTNRMLSSIAAKTGTRGITGDFTTVYLYCPVAAKRICEITPEAKLIIMLRNPVDRAFSEYNMCVKFKRDNRTFEQAVQDDINNVPMNDYIIETYVRRGIYESHLRNYYDLFRKDQIKIIISEDFFLRTDEVVKVTFDFLGIPHRDVKIDYSRVFKNEGRYEKRLDQSTREFLVDYYRPYNESLSRLLGVDPGWN